MLSTLEDYRVELDDYCGPLDLLLFTPAGDPYGAHVGLYSGEGQVLHLAKSVGRPAVWRRRSLVKNCCMAWNIRSRAMSSMMSSATRSVAGTAAVGRVSWARSSAIFSNFLSVSSKRIVRSSQSGCSCALFLRRNMLIGALQLWSVDNLTLFL